MINCSFVLDKQSIVYPLKIMDRQTAAAEERKKKIKNLEYSLFGGQESQNVS